MAPPPHPHPDLHVIFDVLTPGANLMTDATTELLSAFDGHDTVGVLAALQAGADPCIPVLGKTPAGAKR